MKKITLTLTLLAFFVFAFTQPALTAGKTSSKASKKNTATKIKSAETEKPATAPGPAGETAKPKAAVSGIESTIGVPKSAAFVFQISFSGKLRENFSRIISNFAASEEYFRSTASLSGILGAPVPPNAAKYLNKILQASLVIFSRSGENASPEMALVLCADDEKTAAELIQKIRGKIAVFAQGSGSAEVVFNESASGTARIIAVTPKDEKIAGAASNEARLLSSGNTIAFVFQKKGGTKVAEIISCLASKKDTLASTDNFKKLAAGSDKNTFAFLYFGPDFIATAGQNIASSISSVFIGFGAAEDISNAGIVGTISIGEPKNPDQIAAVGLAKTILQGVKSDSTPAGILPASTLAMVEARLNLGKEILELPGLAVLKTLPMINVENDILSWAEGGIFAAIQPVENAKDLMMRGNTPDFYFGIGSSNDQKAAEFAEKVAPFIKAALPTVEVKDETVAGVKVKVLVPANIPVKSIKPTMGVSGNYLLIASSIEAFEKIAAKNSAALSASPEYKSNFTHDPGSFVSFYANCSSINKIITSVMPGAPNNGLTSVIGIASASCKFAGNDLSFDTRFTINASKITPAVVGAVISAIFDNAKKNAPAPNSK